MFRLSDILGGIIAFWITGCSAASADQVASSVHVTNGRVTARNDFPPVVQLKNKHSICSGIFISESSLVTAAHCAIDGITAIDSIHPLRIMIHPQFRRDSVVTIRDIAVLIFPKDESRSYMPLSGRAAKKNDNVTIVGFGANEYADGTGDTSGIGTKRMGQNKIAHTDKGEIIVKGSRYAQEFVLGQNSASGAGDSGGAIIIANRLAGMITAGSIENQTKVTYALDLDWPDVVKFLRTTNAKGADIPGISED